MVMVHARQLACVLHLWPSRLRGGRFRFGRGLKSVLPMPQMGWDSVYEALEDLQDEPLLERVVDALVLVAAMQVKESIDPWLLASLLGLAGVDLEDLDQVNLVSQVAGHLNGAGLLNVDQGMHAMALDEAAAAWGSRYRDLIRLDALGRLSAIEHDYLCRLDAT